MTLELSIDLAEVWPWLAAAVYLIVVYLATLPVCRRWYAENRSKEHPFLFALAWRRRRCGCLWRCLL